ncbi:MULTISPECIES: IS630 family transposase [unclassified Moorena]|uniref:IS630 family transposase n=1 Tax=unclassified Moorena TaxID=2683338 RepID=UPI0013FF699D|nr:MULTISPECIES: IS630 family transposase [unclassified Moorena]NEO17845.1 IS630 family transposase [Moorena sp. SIO3E8]NEQ04414.1 IS630 family transposase [Moorena sp. SIO3F7]
MGRGRRDKIALSTEQRQRLEAISRNGHAPAKKILHAQILLMSDEGELARRTWTDNEIAQALNLHRNTVGRIRQRFLEKGEAPALERKARRKPPVDPIVDGETEAQIIALCCSQPPAGRGNWSIRLLTNELKKRRIVTQIGRETVRKTLKKNQLRPWKTERFCIPERDLPRFVAEMEVVLDEYTRPANPEMPLICMDEASKELHGHLYEPIPMQPGLDVKEDYHYTREGVQALFMFFDPNRGWRRVSCRDHRTCEDWADEIKHLLDVDYPDAPKIRLLSDNLNTHTITSLYKTFPAPEAHRLARRLEMIHTPRNGSWLNVAETELCVLSKQCLDRRLATAEELHLEIEAWQQERNNACAKVVWQFTTEDARVKLKHLYPVFETDQDFSV